MSKKLTNIEHYPLVKNKLNLIPYLFAKTKNILPLEQKEKEVLVAICDPYNLEALQEIQLFLQKKIIPVHCSKEALESAIEKCYQKQKEIAPQEKTSQKDSIKLIDSIEGYDLLEQTSENPVIRLFNMILTDAIGSDASDIHFEPKEKGLQVRFRIDGMLQKRYDPPKDFQNQLITRIKVMAKLDIAEHRLPQDGRIKLKMGEREIDFRVSTIPIVYGERVVLRILDKGNVTLGLNHIGMNRNTLSLFRKLIKVSEGIVLVTGPTGSGKTTTLYSALTEIHSEEVNIMTIEDPVEYKLFQISQIGVNPKINLTFSTGLRHILRQDPDVIMIGEIRDKETAEIAIQASLTGHLVLSTLHTNDAPSAISRLTDMGIEPYLLSSSIMGVLAQRLVRKICPHCKVSYHPLPQEIEELSLPPASYEFYYGKGCESCFDSGYKGRHAIYELMPMNLDIQKQIHQNIDINELRFVSGIASLRENGAELVKQGITTSAEVLRVTRLSVGEF